jgi:hypothetical protein
MKEDFKRAFIDYYDEVKLNDKSFIFLWSLIIFLFISGLVVLSRLF